MRVVAVITRSRAERRSKATLERPLQRNRPTAGAHGFAVRAQHDCGALCGTRPPRPVTQPPARGRARPVAQAAPHGPPPPPHHRPHHASHGPDASHGSLSVYGTPAATPAATHPRSSCRRRTPGCACRAARSPRTRGCCRRGRPSWSARLAEGGGVEERGRPGHHGGARGGMEHRRSQGSGAEAW